MSEELKDQETPDVDPDIEDEEELELSHTDKLVGVFTEPSATFTKMAQSSPKAVDWLIPILLVIIVASLTNYILMSNPEIKYAAIEKQMEQFEKQFDEAVKSGQMTQEQADSQLEMIRERMEQGGGAQMMIQVVATVVIIFIMFFIISAVFLLAAKFGMKGEGGYSHSMVAYGLPAYITVLQLIIMVIAGLAMNKLLTGTSVAAFLDMNAKDSIGGTLLSLVDPLSIWFYAVVSIGYAKLFNTSFGKAAGWIFGLWIGFSIVMFYLSEAVPFLKWFIR